MSFQYYFSFLMLSIVFVVVSSSSAYGKSSAALGETEAKRLVAKKAKPQKKTLSKKPLGRTGTVLSVLGKRALSLRYVREAKKSRKGANFLHKAGMVVTIAGLAIGGASILCFIIASNTNDLSLNLRLHSTALYFGVPLTLLGVAIGAPMWVVGDLRVKHSNKLIQVVDELGYKSKKQSLHSLPGNSPVLMKAQ